MNAVKKIFLGFKLVKRLIKVGFDAHLIGDVVNAKDDALIKSIDEAVNMTSIFEKPLRFQINIKDDDDLSLNNFNGEKRAKMMHFKNSSSYKIKPGELKVIIVKVKAEASFYKIFDYIEARQGKMPNIPGHIALQKILPTIMSAGSKIYGLDYYNRLFFDADGFLCVPCLERDALDNEQELVTSDYAIPDNAFIRKGNYFFFFQEK